MGTRNARELIAATDAAVLRDPDEIAAARTALVAALGKDRAIRTFATAGNFEMMNRLLDGLGVGPAEVFRPLAEEIGVAIPTHFAP